MLKLTDMIGKMRKFNLILAIIFYILSWPCLSQAQKPAEEAAAKKTILIGDLTVLGSYSKVCGGNNLSGLYISTNYAPVVTLSPENYFIPLYSGLYRKQRQIINEEEGGRLYTTAMNHNFSFMHKHIFSDLLTQRLSAYVSLNYNKETSDESFGNGLYDYRDYGTSLDYQYKLKQTETETATLLFGGKYYFREYPNFKTLISLSSRTAPEEDEKNQNVWGPTVRYAHQFAKGLIFSLSYDFLFKDFTDKYTIDSDGILEDKKRQDEVHYFRLNSNYRLGKRFILGLDGEIELNNSNQNYYDSMETAPLPLTDDVFVPHYFNYNRYEIKPSLTFLYPLTEKKNILLKVAYAYTLRNYANRNIKDSGGTYKSETQEDKIHTGILSINYPITAKFSFLINADYNHSTSNMEYEKYYRYDYDVYHILSGLSYKF